MKSILIVGCGFSGAVTARILAENDYKVDIIEKRSHIAGNAYDYVNELGIRIHKYGPHLFHTNNLKVYQWLSRFTDWIPYKHKVKAILSDGMLVTLPVNIETLNIVGRDNVIDTFFRPYTKKMWGLEIEDLDPNILKRVPIRDDCNEFYFPNDRYQGLPKEGYTALIEKIIGHPNITLELNHSFDKSLHSSYFHVFNSMPIDEYFDFCCGQLPYRSIKFHTLTLPLPKLFPTSVVNFTHDGPFTRVTEWKNLPGHGICDTYTTITYEEPCDYADNNFERYYPVKDVMGENLRIYKRYSSMTPSNHTFIGRCGGYAYLDMDQAVAIAMKTADKFVCKYK